MAAKLATIDDHILAYAHGSDDIRDADLTGGKPIMEGLDIQLKNVQISDLGQARKVTIDKNRTVIESRAIYDRVRGRELPKSSTVAASSQNA